MKPIHKRRFLKLASFLEKLRKNKFYYGTLVNKWDNKMECGSVCCAIGWLPAVFPSLWSWANGTLGTGEGLREFFGINHTQECGLFLPNHQHLIGETMLGHDATAKEVAAMIRRFVERNS